MTIKSADLLVANGIVLAMDSIGTRIKNGAVAIKGEKIVAIGETDDFLSWNISQTMDACGGIIMPGLINTHTHLPMSLFKGLADDLPLQVWLNEHIFPAEGKYITPESVRIGTQLSCAEMLLSGTTTCCDGYFFEDEIAEAVKACGIRSVLGQGIIDFPAPGMPDPKNNISPAIAFMDKWKGAVPTIDPSIFCHSPNTCSTQTLTKAKAAADDRALLFQIHASETKHEWDQIWSQQGASPIEYLDKIGVLDQNTLLVHTVWVDDGDIDIIAKRGAKVSHNPESNMKLASGIAPIANLLKAGVTVGIGTDGCASNNNLDLFCEMDVTAKLHKVAAMNPTVMDAGTVVHMATAGGAAAIGLERKIGSLEEGKEADLIVIDTQNPRLAPLYNPISQLVYAAVGSDVREVIVAGRIVVRNRKILTIDLEDLLERAGSIGNIIKRGLTEK
ncbi:MAG: amidohydrolase [Desulfobacterales bacterium]